MPQLVPFLKTYTFRLTPLVKIPFKGISRNASNSSRALTNTSSPQIVTDGNEDFTATPETLNELTESSREVIATFAEGNDAIKVMSLEGKYRLRVIAPNQQDNHSGTQTPESGYDSPGDDFPGENLEIYDSIRLGYRIVIRNIDSLDPIEPLDAIQMTHFL
jgi:hypothetical protein